MDLFKQAYFTKSFYMLGKSLPKCLECSYCRLIGDKKDIIFDGIPSNINPLFINLPVVVNLFYGDPLLQIENTLNYLKKLEEVEHKGPVIIITKGNFEIFYKLNFNTKLDIHFAFSTFGINSEYDGGNLKTFENNLKLIQKTNFKYSIEYRPVIRDVNDSLETIEGIYKIANKYKAPIGFCGLQVNDNLKEYFIKNNINFKPYDGYEFGLKKALSKEVEDRFYNLAEKYDVPTFRKTSCLISYSHSLDRDYNAHYYRPNEMRCSKCKMKEKCTEYKKNNDQSEIKKVNIPFEHEIIFKEKHVCVLFKKGICKFANNDCKNITGKVIKINQKITSSDVRVIKWLTGFTVDCDFDEIEYISNNWIL
jgi:hypothetical protein